METNTTKTLTEMTLGELLNHRETLYAATVKYAPKSERGKAARVEYRKVKAAVQDMIMGRIRESYDK